MAMPVAAAGWVGDWLYYLMKLMKGIIRLRLGDWLAGS